MNVAVRTMLAAVALLLAGCGSDDGPVEPLAMERVAHPHGMLVSPDVVRPGQEFEVRFPQGFPPGLTNILGFALDRRDGDAWVGAWVLVGGSDDPRDVSSVRIWPAAEFVRREIVWLPQAWAHDGGTYLVPMPDEAQDGAYRVCTAPASPSYCADVEVVAGSEGHGVVVSGADRIVDPERLAAYTQGREHRREWCAPFEVVAGDGRVGSGRLGRDRRSAVMARGRTIRASTTARCFRPEGLP